MAATGRRKIGDYLIGTPDDTVSANPFQGMKKLRFCDDKFHLQ